MPVREEQPVRSLDIRIGLCHIAFQRQQGNGTSTRLVWQYQPLLSLIRQIQFGRCLDCVKRYVSTGVWWSQNRRRYQARFYAIPWHEFPRYKAE